MDSPVRPSLDIVNSYGTLTSNQKTPNPINPDLLKLEGDREIHLSLLKDQGFTVFDPNNSMDVENAFMAFSENCPDPCSKSDFTTALKELMFQAKEAIKRDGPTTVKQMPLWIVRFGIVGFLWQAGYTLGAHAAGRPPLEAATSFEASLGAGLGAMLGETGSVTSIGYFFTSPNIVFNANTRVGIKQILFEATVFWGIPAGIAAAAWTPLLLNLCTAPDLQ